MIINDESALLSQLQLGMYVDVQGEQNLETRQGIADRVEYRDLVRAPIQAINVETNTLIVLGLRVNIDESTFLYGIDSIATLQPDDVVRISGAAIFAPPNLPPTINATLLEYLPQADNTFSVVSALRNIDQATQTFFIGTQRLAYGDASVLPTPFREQVRVKVRGRRISQDTDVFFVVDEVSELPLTPLPEGSVVQIDGRVTRYVNPQNFDVEFRPVSLPQALAESLEMPLHLGLFVDLSGISNAEGIIEIDHLEINESLIPEPSPDQIRQSLIRVNGVIQDIGIENQMPNTLTLLGLTGLLNEETTYRDAENPNYGVDDLRVGDTVFIVGNLTPQGELRVTSVTPTLMTSQNRHQLMGNSSNVDSVSQQLSILGINVLTSEQTRYYNISTINDFILALPSPTLSLRAPAETEVDAETFFHQLQSQPNNVAYTDGVPQGNQIVANELVLLPFELSVVP